jgi:dTDP-4-dehydrorhamnose 3,5-epimerase-like enzyme
MKMSDAKNTRSFGDCKLIELPKIQDPRGNLTFVEAENHIPFPIKRMFLTYGIPQGAARGGHALKSCVQLLMASSGSFDVILRDGKEERTYRLEKPNHGLLLPPMIWREMENFSDGAVCLVLASEPYDESGYYRDFDDFVNALG